MSTSDDTTVQPDPVHGAEAVRFGGWDWQDPRHGEHFRRCSYCGSVHPDDPRLLAPRGRAVLTNQPNEGNHHAPRPTAPPDRRPLDRLAPAGLLLAPLGERGAGGSPPVTQPPRKANFHANYRGDCSHMVGEVVGPTTYRQYQVAIGAVYDPAADRTRVGFAPAEQADVDAVTSWVA